MAVVMRKCVATRTSHEQKQLFRVVKYEGVVSLDPTYKAKGRGAYILKSEDAILLAKKNKSLNKAFECEVDDSIYDELLKALERGCDGKK